MPIAEECLYSGLETNNRLPMQLIELHRGQPRQIEMQLLQELSMLSWKPSKTKALNQWKNCHVWSGHTHKTEMNANKQGNGSGTDNIVNLKSNCIPAYDSEVPHLTAQGRYITEMIKFLICWIPSSYS